MIRAAVRLFLQTAQSNRLFALCCTVALGLAIAGSWHHVRVSLLIGDLRSPNPQIRGDAAFDLGKIRDARAVEPLIIELRDPDSVNAEVAAEALGDIGDRRAVEPIIAAVKGNMLIDFGAEKALEQIGSPSFRPLLHALEGSAPEFRQFAFRTLVKLANQGSEYDLIEALGKFGDKKSAEYLLNSGNPDLREAAESWGASHGYQVY